MYAQHILCRMSKGTFQILQKLSNPYTERYYQCKIEILSGLRFMSSEVFLKLSQGTCCFPPLRWHIKQPQEEPLTGTNQRTPNLKKHIYKNITSNIPSFGNLTLPFRNYQMEMWIIRIQIPSAQICNNWTWHFDGLWLQELLHLSYTYDVLVSNFRNNTTRHHHQTLGCGIAFSRKNHSKIYLILPYTTKSSKNIPGKHSLYCISSKTLS